MNKFIKTLIITAVVVVVGFICYGASKAFVFGNYFAANPIMGILGVIALVALVYGAFKGIKTIWVLPLLFVLFFTQGCNYAKSNQQIVVSDDCGMNWKLINAGDAVPKAGVNPCYMKVVIPNFPMQGEAKFIGNLKEKVRANVLIDYDYSITKPLVFIKQAKFLGKANSDADEESAVGSGFEQAENVVIDKRIKEVAKDIFIDADIVELDQSELESHLLIEINKILEPLGVTLNFITLTFDLDGQTRQAIDVATAMKIYESRGLQDLGRQVISQRAGATKVTVENHTDKPAEQ